MLPSIIISVLITILLKIVISKNNTIILKRPNNKNIKNNIYKYNDTCYEIQKE